MYFVYSKSVGFCHRQEWADGCGRLQEDIPKRREADWKMPRKKQQNPQPVKCRYYIILSKWKFVQLTGLYTL